MCLLRSDELWVYEQDYLWILFGSSLNSYMHDLISLQVSSNGLVWPTRLIFLAMGEMLSFGFNLAVSFPMTAGAARHVLYCCHRG